MERLLKLKHWQIFSLIIIAPIFLIIFGGVISKVTGIRFLGTFFASIAALTIIISYFGWIWTTGNLLFRHGIKIKIINFKVFNFCFILSLVLFFGLIPYLKTVLSTENMYLINILTIIYILFFFYCIFFIAKSLNFIENQNSMKTNPLFLDFLLIWILPIGIWLIQQRLKRILLNDKKDAQ